MWGVFQPRKLPFTLGPNVVVGTESRHGKYDMQQFCSLFVAPLFPQVGSSPPPEILRQDPVRFKGVL
jgi:hypothetical protein